MVDVNFPIISLLIALPIIAGLVIPLIFKKSQKYLLHYSISVALIELFLSVYSYRLILIN